MDEDRSGGVRIAVVGPGAMGCLLAAFLAKAKEEVCLIDHNSERVKNINEDGIKIEGISGEFTIKVKATAEPKEIGICQLVVICVKSYDTEEAIKSVKELIGENTQVLTLQNGIGNVQILNDIVGEDKVIGGVTSHGATVLGPGHIRHAGKGETIIGKANGKVLGPIREVVNVLNTAGFETKVSKDINGLIWSKLIINVGINALTAATRLNNGRLIEYDGTKEIMRAAVQEAVKVAKRKRIKLVYDDPIQKVEGVAKATAGNISSMLQDVLKKRRTEIDFINGAIVRQGKALNMPTPVNETLTNLIKTIESSYDKQLS
ncbi:MAG: 2-dehydropantoate 2-reductase [Candidatus Omnitrophica bacterium]|nr:2-dehydropantoate 2-reductase [Candidatus Omnitrophota bacterium]